MHDTNLQIEIENDLTNFICDSFFIDENDIQKDISLIEAGIIDSIGLIEMAAYITEKYRITIDENDINDDNFGSLNKIISYILNNIV